MNTLNSTIVVILILLWQPRCFPSHHFVLFHSCEFVASVRRTLCDVSGCVRKYEVKSYKKCVKCLVLVYFVLSNSKWVRTDSPGYYIWSKIHLDSGTRNISYGQFQNGCVLKDPLSAFVFFFQHDSGIILSEIWLREVREIPNKI